MTENKFNKIFLEDKRPFLWIIFIVLFVYGVTLFSGIIYLDDNVLVTGQYQFNKSLLNIPRAFSEDIFQTPVGGGTFYRPIERITFILDAQLGEGAIIFMSHFSNVLLHILAIYFLYLFLVKLKIKKEIAFLFSLIFAVHPLTAQTVAFISGRNDSLLAVFVFPAFIFLIDYLDTKDKKYFIWHLLFLALALFTKETAAVLPIISAFYILIFIGWKEIIKDYKTYLNIGLGWLSVGLTWFLIRGLVLHAAVGNAPYNIPLSIYNNLPSLIPAIGKVFLPFNLSVFPVVRDMTMVYGIVSIVLLSIWFILSKKRNMKMIVFGFSWFFIFIVLTLIKPLNTVPEFSENRIYIPMFGFIFVILGLGLIKIPSFINKLNFNWRKIILFISLVIILIFGVVTIYRNKYYENKLNFWKNATETSPSFAFNHNNLGAMFYLDRDMYNAEKEFKIALMLNPKEPMSHNNLGLVYSNKGLEKEAEEEYKKEIEINPTYENAYLNLGLLYFKQGNIDEAINNWKTILTINPNNVDALKSLTLYYYEEKNLGEAAIYGGRLYSMGVELPADLLRIIQLSSIR